MVTDSAARSGRRLDRLEAVFDDQRVVANAGVLLASTLSDRLGIEALVDECVVLADRSAGARAGAKVLSLVHAMLLGADWIDDADVLEEFQYSDSSKGPEDQDLRVADDVAPASTEEPSRRREGEVEEAQRHARHPAHDRRTVLLSQVRILKPFRASPTTPRTLAGAADVLTYQLVVAIPFRVRWSITWTRSTLAAES